MPFISDILKHQSLSIVGLEKNTGKTVCLNYVLSRLHEENIPVVVTSIGVDGEQTDAVFATAKPEIILYEGMKFITSEKHYLQRRLVSKLLDVDMQRTSLGHLVTGEVLCQGKVLISGAATTQKLRSQIQQFHELFIVDGALSRLSLASPAVTQAMVLATGAAVSPNIQRLISKTRFVHRLINLEEVDEHTKQALDGIEHGLWSLDSEGIPHDLGIASVFLLGKQSQGDIFRYGNTLFASGAVSDRLLKFLISQPNIKDIVLIVCDFTKLFITLEVYAEYTRRGGRLLVMQRSQLVAVTLNPTSPSGYQLHSQEACAQLSDALQTPVYDVMQITSHHV